MHSHVPEQLQFHLQISLNNYSSDTSQVVKNTPANAGDIRDVGSVPGWGRPPGGSHGSPLQCSRLENPMDRGAWPAIVHGVAQSQIPIEATYYTHTHIP